MTNEFNTTGTEESVAGPNQLNMFTNEIELNPQQKKALAKSIDNFTTLKRDRYNVIKRMYDALIEAGAVEGVDIVYTSEPMLTDKEVTLYAGQESFKVAREVKFMHNELKVLYKTCKVYSKIPEIVEGSWELNTYDFKGGKISNYMVFDTSRGYKPATFLKKLREKAVYAENQYKACMQEVDKLKNLLNQYKESFPDATAEIISIWVKEYGRGRDMDCIKVVKPNGSYLVIDKYNRVRKKHVAIFADKTPEELLEMI